MGGSWEGQDEEVRGMEKAVRNLLGPNATETDWMEIGRYFNERACAYVGPEHGVMVAVLAGTLAEAAFMGGIKANVKASP